MRRLAPQALAAAACLLLASVALGHGRLDSSFGKRGVVDVRQFIAKGRWVGYATAAPDGGIYLTEPRPLCYRGGCPYSVRLKHLLPSGSLDRRFGRAGRGVTANSSYDVTVAVDAAGGAVMAWDQPEKGRRGIFMRRYRADGSRELSFGNGGTLFIDCGCYVDSVTAVGRKILVGGHREEQDDSARWFFTRLLASGEPDSSFGRRRGRVWLLRGYFPPDVVLPLHRGGVLLGGFRTRGYDNAAPYVLRMSAGGRLDRSFDSQTRRALAGVYQTGRDAVGWEGLSLVARPHGRIAVYGDAYNRGVAIGLLRDGSRDTAFGKGGVTLLPFEISDAAPDGSGGALAVVYRRRHYNYAVIRVRPDGRMDRGFGQVGLPGAYNEYGLAISNSDRGAVVWSAGETVCRSSCPSHPLLFRLAPTGRR